MSVPCAVVPFFIAGCFVISMAISALAWWLAHAVFAVRMWATWAELAAFTLLVNIVLWLLKSVLRSKP